MLTHLYRLGSSAAVLTAAYWLYALLAVPWIEPSLRLPNPGHRKGETANAARQDDLSSLFPPGAWQLDRRQVKMLRTPQGILLFRDYRPRKEGKLDLDELSLIIHARPRGNGKSASRRLVLDAPQGAELQFDSELDLARGQVGKLIGGRLAGEITIRGPETAPGVGDDLLITTQGVQMEPTKIWTPHVVEFRYGPNTGTGRDLMISLGQSSGGKQFGLGQVERVELVHVDSLDLQLPARGLLGGSDAERERGASRRLGAGPEAQRLPSPGSAPVPVKLTCDGPLQFDVASNAASFEENVRVSHPNPDGTVDELRGDLLELFFAARRASEDSSPDVPPASPRRARGMAVERLVATGRPAILRAPSLTATARGARLEYDVNRRAVRIQDPNLARVEQLDRHLEGLDIEYALAEESQRLGQLEVRGPGLFEGTQPANAAGPGRRVTAKWRERVELRPDGELHRLTLAGTASIQVEGGGNIGGDQLHVWLEEIPLTAPTAGSGQRGKYDIRPVKIQIMGLGEPSSFGENVSHALTAGTADMRLLGTQGFQRNQDLESARPNAVHFDSPRLSGATRLLEIWIDHEPPSPVSGRLPASTTEAAGPLLAGPPSGQSPADRLLDSSPPARSTMTRIAPAPTAGQKIDVIGDRILARMRLADREPIVDDITIDGKVRVVELQDALARELPLEITGSWLHVIDANSPQAQAEIRGAPAEASMRGMTIKAANIHLHRGENRTWIDGPGELSLPMSQGAAGLPVRQGGRWFVTWQGGMQFDGGEAVFQQEVAARGSQQLSRGELSNSVVRGQRLDARLTRRIDFQKPDDRQPVDLQRLFFPGAVTIENKTSTAEQQQVAWEHLTVRDLDVDQVTGRVYGRGPGTVTSVRLGRNPYDEQPAAPGGPSAATQLMYLRVLYRKELVGNLHQREVTLRDKIQALHAPVATWFEQPDESIITTPRGRGAVLRGQELSVIDMGTRAKPALEIIASGDTRVDGRSRPGFFSAESARITFSEAKGRVHLEGDGRTDAVLRFRERNSDRPQETSAQAFDFWPRTNNIQIQGEKEMRFGRGPAGSGQR